MGLFRGRVAKNIAALMILQVGNYVIPLLMVPYLVRVLGLAAFGTWMFALSFVTLARILVSYGFDLTATRQVAMAQANVGVVSQVLADVTAARALLWFVALSILAGALFLSPPMWAIRWLVLAAMFSLIGDLLFPVWLFQGMETMATITKIRLASKFANLGLVMLLVKDPDDVVLVPLIESFTAIGAGVFGLTLGFRNFGLTPGWPRLSGVIFQFKEAGAIFVSTLSVQLYTTANVVVLGFVAGPLAVASYSVADKIYSALRGLLSPVVQAVFPALARTHAASREEFVRIFHQALRVLFPALSLVGLLLYFSAYLIVRVVAGEEDMDAVRTLQVMAWSFPLAVGSFLSPMLVVQGAQRKLMMITLGCGIFSLVIIFPLVSALGAVGGATAFLIVQALGAFLLLLANQRLIRRV